MKAKDLLIKVEGVLPNKVRHAALVWRRLHHWQRAGIIFVHIPKSAGSSVNSAIYGRFMGHSTASDIKSYAPTSFRRLPSFAITRNPWDRCLSAYRFAKSGAGKGEGIKAAIQNPQQYKIDKFDSFERFVEEWLITKNIECLDPVFRPQYPFVCDKEMNILVSWTTKLENISEFEKNISSMLNKKILIPNLNQSGPKVMYKDFYNKKLVELVGSIYKRDIELFGYDF